MYWMMSYRLINEVESIKQDIKQLIRSTRVVYAT